MEEPTATPLLFKCQSELFRSSLGSQIGGAKLTQQCWPSGRRDRGRRSAGVQRRLGEERVVAEEGGQQWRPSEPAGEWVAQDGQERR